MSIDFMPQGEHFNCYTDNYLVHSFNEKTYMTQLFVDNESSYVDMSITVRYYRIYIQSLQNLIILSSYIFKS